MIVSKLIAVIKFCNFDFATGFAMYWQPRRLGKARTQRDVAKTSLFETQWATSRLGFKATAISAAIRCSPYLVQVLLY
jgi:hypothetical protein